MNKLGKKGLSVEKQDRINATIGGVVFGYFIARFIAVPIISIFRIGTWWVYPWAMLMTTGMFVIVAALGRKLHKDAYR